MSTDTESASTGAPWDRVADVIDIDSHEMIPLSQWGDVFGPIGEIVGEMVTPNFGRILDDGGGRADDTGIDDRSVWEVKGPTAPSAMDLGRRPAVMDQMGIRRQLVFPTFALTAVAIYYNENAAQFFGYEDASYDRLSTARAAIDAHNDWVARITTSVDAERLRPVGIVLTETVEQMVGDARRLVEDGVRAVWLPAGSPPAGTSPADRVLDEFWDVFAIADVPVVSHIGAEFGFLASNRWGANVDVFRPSTNSSVEFPIEPYRAATIQFTQENLLTSMVLGGVFERHPRLRFGVIECGSCWVGPLADRLDLWEREFHSRLAASISLKPSEYLARNVRVTPFVFEAADLPGYIRARPDLANVYCYSSDFPHREGGTRSLETFMGALSEVGPEFGERFFRANGELLLPGS